MVCNQAIEVRQFNHRCLHCHEFEKLILLHTDPLRVMENQGVILLRFIFKRVKLREPTLLSSPLARLTVRLA